MSTGSDTSEARSSVQGNKGSNAAYERSPLLAPSNDNDEDLTLKQDDVIPWLQIAVLSFARMIEGWNWFSIFSYIAEYVQSVGVEESDIGFYTGLVESIYSVTQFFAMQFVWRWASDKYGRKPVLLVTLSGLSVSAVAFGLSTNVCHMILFRSLAGVFSGSLITVRIMFQELSTPSTRARVLSFFAFSGSLPIFLAPLTGGLLARPAERFALFKNVTILRTYPYLLPSLCTGVIGAVACLLSALFLQETRPWKDTDNVKLPSTMSILRSRGVGTVFLINVFACFIGFSYWTVLPVFWYTRPSLGGLGLSSQVISITTAVSGIFQATLLVTLGPMLQKHSGTSRLLFRAGIALASNCSLAPLLNIVARNATPAELYTFMAVGIVLSGCQAITFNVLQVAIAEVCPSPEAMGKLNSVFASTGIAVRAITPVIATSTFAFGVTHRVFGGQFFWLLLSLAAMGYCVYVRASSRILKEAAAISNDEE